MSVSPTHDQAAGPPTRIPLLYLGGWVLLGAFALFYMALLLFKPQSAQKMILQPPPGMPESNQGQRALSKALADLSELRSTLERLDGQLQDARSVIQTHERRSVALEVRLTGLESRLRDTRTPVAQAEPATLRSEPLAVRTEELPGAGARKANTEKSATERGDSHERLAGRTVEGTVAEPAGPAPVSRGLMGAPQLLTATATGLPQTAAMQSAPSREATSRESIAPVQPGTRPAPPPQMVAPLVPTAPMLEVPAPPPAVAPELAPIAPLPAAKATVAEVTTAPPRPQYGLVIASGPTLDAIRLTWLLLQEGHKSTLRSLEPRFVETDNETGAFQLMAGPVAGREAAVKACERIKAKQGRCTVVPFAGRML